MAALKLPAGVGDALQELVLWDVTAATAIVSRLIDDGGIGNVEASLLKVVEDKLDSIGKGINKIIG